MATKFATKLAALSLLACTARSATEREPASATPPNANTQTAQASTEPAVRDATVPFVVRVVGPDNPRERLTGRMTLVVVIERNLVDATPLRLTWQLPDGVTLVDGKLEEVIVESASSRITRQIVLEVPSIPETDVQAFVEANGAGWGAKGEGAYRFGRPEPMLPKVPRERKPLPVKGGPPLRPVMMPPPSGPR